MRDAGVDGMLVSNPIELEYLIGFHAENAWLVVTARAATLLSDRRFEEQLARQVPYVRAIMRKQGLAKELKKLADRYHIQKLAIQADHLTVNARQAIVKQLGGSALEHTEGWLLEQRAVKDDTEVRAIRQAIRIQERAFADFQAFAEPGMRERDLCAYLEYCMKCHGSDGPSFPTIVAANANSSIPHHMPGPTRWKKHQPLLIDFGALHQGYCSDMTRVLTAGAMSKQLQRIYQIVRQAKAAGVRAVAPGVSCEAVDRAARQIIEEAGYGDQFSHGLGHGIGMEVHESPRLGKKQKHQLRPGEVITIEPGIYLPGVGGVRLEDDVLVTETGHRNLSRLTTDPDAMTL
jgi:Xaa-Pro aminopeptidase